MGYLPPIVVRKRDLKYYSVIGKVVAKAIIEGVTINCPLSRIVFKQILDEPFKLEDLVFVDNDLYNSLKYMKKNSVEGVFFETFRVKKVFNEKTHYFDLKENGDTIDLTNDNKKEYIQLRIQLETKKIY